MEGRSTGTAPPKQVVKSFYDSYGWKKGAQGQYQDQVDFEDTRPVSSSYRRACHLRVKRFIAPQGDFLLDAASGPVQYAEYLEYSSGYRKRVCVDFSMRALQEARDRLGDHGAYVLADVTCLPFRPEVFDAFVSLHTIYHVPAEEQADAFRELNRTLKRGRSGVVVYAWRRSALLPVRRIVSSVLRKFERIRDSLGQGTRPEAPALYYAAYDRRWVARMLGEHHIQFDIRSWRSVSVPFLRRFIPDCVLGRVILQGLFWLEDRIPHILGRVGRYPLIVIERRIPGREFTGRRWGVT